MFRCTYQSKEIPHQTVKETSITHLITFGRKLTQLQGKSLIYPGRTGKYQELYEIFVVQQKMKHITGITIAGKMGQK